MFIRTIIALGALLSTVVAVPLQEFGKRDIVWVTHIAEDVVTVEVTTTIWVHPGQETPAPSPDSANNHRQKITSHIRSTITVVPSPAQGNHHKKITSHIKSTVTVLPSAAKKHHHHHHKKITSQIKSTLSVPKPSPTQASPPAHTKPASGGSAHGQTYTGDITWYTPGLGSCGQESTTSDAIVAIPHGMMTTEMAAAGVTNPNVNPWCGKTITISNAGKEAQATIVDTCEGCDGASIDLSPSLFQTLVSGGLGVGRVHNVNWWFND